MEVFQDAVQVVDKFVMMEHEVLVVPVPHLIYMVVLIAVLKITIQMQIKTTEVVLIM